MSLDPNRKVNIPGFTHLSAFDTAKYFIYAYETNKYKEERNNEKIDCSLCAVEIPIGNNCIWFKEKEQVVVHVNCSKAFEEELNKLNGKSDNIKFWISSNFIDFNGDIDINNLNYASIGLDDNQKFLSTIKMIEERNLKAKKRLAFQNFAYDFITELPFNVFNISKKIFMSGTTSRVVNKNYGEMKAINPTWDAGEKSIMNASEFNRILFIIVIFIFILSL